MKVKFKNNRLKLFKRVKVDTKQSVKRIPKNRMTWHQASIRYPNMRAFKDADRDGLRDSDAILD